MENSNSKIIVGMCMFVAGLGLIISSVVADTVAENLPAPAAPPLPVVIPSPPLPPIEVTA